MHFLHVLETVMKPNTVVAYTNKGDLLTYMTIIIMWRLNKSMIRPTVHSKHFKGKTIKVFMVFQPIGKVFPQSIPTHMSYKQ